MKNGIEKSIFLVYFLSKPMFILILQLPEKGPRPKCTIYKHESDKNNKCRSIGLFGILSVVSVVVLYSGSIAYTCLFIRGLKFLIKIPYFIQNYPKVVGFLIFESLCLDRSKTLAYV